MSTIAVIGAGDLGGAVAQALAARDRVARILIVDAAGAVAAGKALDIQQMGAVDAFHARVDGTVDSERVVGCAACVIADRFGRPASEWHGEEGAAMLARLTPFLDDAPIILAGATQGDLMLSAVRGLGIARRRVIGSAPEAFAAAVRGLVALEARCSPREVALAVVGAPGGLVVPWSEASIGGYALERVLSQVQLNRVAARAARVWPPGPYTLGAAAARVAAALVESSRQSFSVLTVLGGEFNVKDRVGALPVLLAQRGIVQSRVPALSSRERVLVESSLGAP
jgi:malate/lactate dehydrogenase